VVAVVSHEPALFVGLADRRIELERGKVVHRNARQAPVSAEAR